MFKGFLRAYKFAEFVKCNEMFTLVHIYVKLKKSALQTVLRASGGTGIRVGLKNQWEQSCEGSIPSLPTRNCAKHISGPM